MKGQAMFLLLSYLNAHETKLYGLLNVSYFYLSQYIPSINIVKLLFYFMIKDKFKEVFRTMNFEHFCPDLENDNCLNLILLLFANIVKGNMNILFIYSLLIFKFKFIFTDFEGQIISKFVLEDSAIKTLDYVNKVNLSESLIFEYTVNDYLFNLRNKLSEIKHENMLYKITNNLTEKDEKKEIEKGREEKEEFKNSDSQVNDKMK